TFPFDHDAFEATYTTTLQNPMARLLIAELDGSIVGYLLGFRHGTFWAGKEVWWVEELLVDAAQRGRGIGRTLTNRFEAEAQSAGARLVCLVTRKSADFYRAIGYEEFAIYFRKVI